MMNNSITARACIALLSFVFAVGVVACSDSSKAGGASDSLVVVDIGRVSLGSLSSRQLARGVIRYLNEGSGDIKIRSFRVSCGCVSVLEYPNSVGRGESFDVSFAVDVSGQVGRNSQSITFVSGDGASLYVCDIVYDVNEALRFEPATLIAQAGKNRVFIEKTILVIPEEYGAAFPVVECVQEGVVVEVGDLESDSFGRHIRNVLISGAIEGSQESRLSIVAKMPVESGGISATVVVVCQVPRGILISPPVVYLSGFDGSAVIWVNSPRTESESASIETIPPGCAIADFVGQGEIHLTVSDAAPSRFDILYSDGQEDVVIPVYVTDT